MAADAALRSLRDEPSEEARIAAVRRYDILDTPADGTFDRITALAAAMLDVPIAIVSIVDEDRIWFKSRHGLEVAEIDREPGLCASAILGADPLLLPDARLDPVALTNPLVAGEFGLRFYAGAPLTTSDGHNLGTLCVIDREPRELDDRQVGILEDLAALVVHELEVRLEARKAVAHETDLRIRAVEEQRYAGQLAETLRRSLLPPLLPSVPGVELAARFRPFDRSKIGGDFYDVFPLPDEAWGLVIGDVCGKGPEAAALTAAARYMVRAAAIEHGSPAAALQVVNEGLLVDNASGERFCTLVFARLRHVADGLEVVLACGGHPLPRVLRAGGHVDAVGQPGTLVGILPQAIFHDARTTLVTGDALVLFTDGLTEARTEDSADGLLGTDGIERLLRARTGDGAEDIAARLERAAGAIRDDLAVLVARATATG
jgi:sigma-B regulation protein RsbU (phosphoserine phosphatase)